MEETNLNHTDTVPGRATNEAVIDLTDSWLNADGAQGLHIIHEATSSGADARQFARQMVNHLRMILLLQATGEESFFGMSDAQKEAISRQAQRAPRTSLIEAARVFREAAQQQAVSWQPQLPLELAFIELLPDEPAPLCQAAPVHEAVEPMTTKETVAALLSVASLKQIPIMPAKGFFLLFSVVAISALFYWFNANSPVVYSDSVFYFAAARSVMEGHGFTVYGNPMTHWAPGYPALLAGMGVLANGDIINGARILGAFLFGANALLVGIAVWLSTNRSRLAAGIALLFFVFSYPVFISHTTAMSDAPFVLLMLSSFVLLSLYIAHGHLALLIFCSLAAGFAVATRYAAIAILPPMVLTLFYFSDRPRKRKLVDTALFLSLSLAPLASWFLRNLLTIGRTTNREMVFHPIGPEHVTQALNTIYGAFLPLDPSAWFKAAAILAIALLFLFAAFILFRKGEFRPRSTTTTNTLPVLLILFALTYSGFLVLSISFFDALTPLDDRILLPLILALFAAGISLLWSIAHHLQRPLLWYGSILLIFLSISMNVARTRPNVQYIRENGFGYTASYWRDSEILTFIGKVDPGQKLYTNEEYAVRFLTGTDRQMSDFPQKFDALTQVPNANYESEMMQVAEEIINGESVAIDFEYSWKAPHRPTADDIRAFGDLPEVYNSLDGVVFGQINQFLGE